MQFRAGRKYYVIRHTGFAGTTSGLINHGTLVRQVFGTVQAKCGIVNDAGRPKYGPHAFRHFTASWLIEQGFGPKRITAIMGHAIGRHVPRGC